MCCLRGVRCWGAEHRIARLGIGRKFQSPRVFEQLTVRENLALAVSRPKQPWTLLIGGLRSSQRDRVQHLMSIVNLQKRADWLAGALSHGQKQWLEIAMLVGQDPDLLLVDEPSLVSPMKRLISQPISLNHWQVITPFW